MRLKSTSHPESVISLPMVFPGLYVCIDETVVFMTGYGGGSVIYAPSESIHYLGEYSERWDMKVFKPFEGEIILKSDKGDK